MCRVFIPKEFDFAAKFLIYGWIKSYLHVDTDVGNFVLKLE